MTASILRYQDLFRDSRINSEIQVSIHRIKEYIIVYYKEFIIKPQLLNGNNNGHISNQKGSVTTHV
jgi:hypothetical protein